MVFQCSCIIIYHYLNLFKTRRSARFHSHYSNRWHSFTLEENSVRYYIVAYNVLRNMHETQHSTKMVVFSRSKKKYPRCLQSDQPILNFLKKFKNPGRTHDIFECRQKLTGGASSLASNP